MTAILTTTRLLLLLGALNACATMSRPGRTSLSTDRAAFTAGAMTVAAQTVQVETGTAFERAGSQKESAFGEVVVRAGVSDRAELRVGLNSYAVVRSPFGRSSGLQDGSVGARLRLLDGAVWGPSVAVTVMSSVPSGARVFRSDLWQPEAQLAASWRVGARATVGTGAGYAWVREEIEGWGQPFVSASLGFGISERVGSFVEYRGVFPTLEGALNQQRAGGGFTFAAGHDVQFDVRGAVRLSRYADRNYSFGAGLSRRF